MYSVYIADLVYDTVKSNYVVPLNAGFLAAMIASEFAAEVDIRIFKYPTELERAMRERAPDMLCMSNYSWNTRLNRVFARLCKRLNPDCSVVMGGPNIRTTAPDIEAFLRERPELDHYVMFEGERPLLELVRSHLDGHDQPTVPGCASIIDDRLVYDPIDQMKQPKTTEYPSPYLSGMLDEFLADRNMIPLLETNRGCPFGCSYCTWGISALSLLRKRPLSMVLDEIDYIAEHGAGQAHWIFCDANFGILHRDVEIARKVRSVMDAKGVPVSVTFWQSKNTTERNLEISELIGSATQGYIAIQSSDPVVLENIGRGAVRMEAIRDIISYYKAKGLPVLTDLLVGLPGETRASHLGSIKDAFDMGFDIIQPYNIRMLPGSRYETAEERERFGVVTKFRPIFGAYGRYDSTPVFEIEEGVRATTAMDEDQLDSFKVLHWLMYFCWNSGVGRFLLKFAQENGVNPGAVLDQVAATRHPLLRECFDEMLRRSREEWFDSMQDIVEHFSQPANHAELVQSFTKLNSLYLCLVYQSRETVQLFSLN